MIEDNLFQLLRCPVTGQMLHERDGYLMTKDEQYSYRINKADIPLFAEIPASEDSRRQQEHYDRVAKQYLVNLGYPHTQEYMRYLDREFLSLVTNEKLDQVAEICCGSGEALELLDTVLQRGVGVDISVKMLSAARIKLPAEKYFFIQGDATRLPLADAVFDCVFILGGIHHVNDREKLFSEVFRILKPSGRFYWREPVSDFFLWRVLRAIVYRLSNSLDHATERPLLFEETLPPLKLAGFQLQTWRTYGFFGYCLLMNSDILIFNRLFRYLPGIRQLTRLMTRIDDWTLKLPGLRNSGLIVMGIAEKPQEINT